MANQIAFQFEPIATALPFVRDGKLRALAVTSLEPSPLLPGVPAIAGAGVPGYEAINLLGLIGPAGLRPEVLERLGGAMRTVLTDPSTVEKFAALGTEARYTTPAAFFDIMRTQAETWIPVIQAAGLKLE
jgi:tripartite-type tricarboxylate transporter receptor subunit TctC